jgi:peptide deformylase
MAVRKIRIWPDPALSEVAKPVESIDDDIRTLVDDMFETMYEANGVGLAATQIAVPHRVLVIDLDPSKDAADNPDIQAELDAFLFKGAQEFINPQIVASEGSIVWEEGCLSVPGYTDQVKRAEKIEVEAMNREGETFRLEAAGLYAVALQHEMDHLDGKVFVQYLSRLKRDSVKRKMNKMKKAGIDDGVEAAANL